MSNDQTMCVQAPAQHQERRISVQHLELVLFTRRLYRATGKAQPCRWAAVSNGHNSLGNGCPRRPHSPDMQRHLLHPPMFVHIGTVSERLVRRVRLTYGLPEVRKTWGTGYKALLAETQRGVSQS